MVHQCVVSCVREELVVGLSLIHPEVRAIEMSYVFVEGQVTYVGISEGSTATYTPNDKHYLDDGSNDVRTC